MHAYHVPVLEDESQQGQRGETRLSSAQIRGLRAKARLAHQKEGICAIKAFNRTSTEADTYGWVVIGRSRWNLTII
jgi:hypothetical protein